MTRYCATCGKHRLVEGGKVITSVSGRYTIKRFRCAECAAKIRDRPRGN